ncbi:vWA domain-containing protein [Neobacillus dielmonensis]|uniref:vWA domain-containing protein n=1 Tax=Neobacillus dielmonensis TaxID=1347369 RepID=UPI0005A5E9F5|nr:VWA domain-containing protein [Neobacillus dielmonensis]
MDFKFQSEELYANPAARLPICLVLDTSGSMSGEPIERLRLALQNFINDILRHDVARATADLAVITFGKKVTTLMDFQNVKPKLSLPIQAHGQTPLGDAMTLACNLIDQRIGIYQSTGVEYYKPWLVFFTDGAPTDDIELSVKKTVNAYQNNKLVIYPVAVGDYADLEVLKRYSPDHPPLVMDEMKFEDFFSWLSESVQRVSESLPGEPVDYGVPDKWHHMDAK